MAAFDASLDKTGCMALIIGGEAEIVRTQQCRGDSMPIPTTAIPLPAQGW